MNKNMYNWYDISVVLVVFRILIYQQFKFPQDEPKWGWSVFRWSNLNATINWLI